MALKKPRLANIPVLDDNGYATGTITEIEYEDEEESKYDDERYLFSIVSSGSLKDIKFKFWTGLSVSPTKYSNAKIGKVDEYSNLTIICTRLKLVTIAEIKAIKSEEDFEKLNISEKLESLKGQLVRFKLTKGAKGTKSQDLSVVDIKTIELLKVSES